MDVYGQNPSDEVGKYFRRNVWGWRPLWNFVIDHDLIPKTVARRGHYNDGAGLDADGSVELSKCLLGLVDSGLAAEYVAKRNAELAALPAVTCYICAGTGGRLPPPTSGAGSHPCNGCDSKGSKPSYDTYYSLDVQDIAEFAAFLAKCGGFSIN
jgi:hypothetical protein